jgi:hypothetical protein
MNLNIKEQENRSSFLWTSYRAGCVSSPVTESTPYEVLESLDGIEIRKYPTMVLAKVTGLSDDMAFRILFRYITGQNKVRKDIAMTVPVISSGATYKRIAMTRPVFSDEDSFAFVMPSVFSISTVPEPLDERIVMIETKPRRLAAMRFSGRPHDDSIKQMEERLISVLRKRGIAFKGAPFLMRYNGPGTPGFIRRNEVAVELSQ